MKVPVSTVGSSEKVLEPARTLDGTRLSNDLIQKRIRQKVREIEYSYLPIEKPSDYPIVVGVQFGAIFIHPMVMSGFSAGFRMHVGTIRAKSYKKNGVRSDVKISKPSFDSRIRGRRILLVDDIAETGHTLLALKNWFLEHDAAEVRTFALLTKPAKLECEIQIDWSIFELAPDQWVFGLGLDDNNLFRHFSNIVIVRDPKPPKSGPGFTRLI